MGSGPDVVDATGSLNRIALSDGLIVHSGGTSHVQAVVDHITGSGASLADVPCIRASFGVLGSEDMGPYGVLVSAIAVPSERIKNSYDATYLGRTDNESLRDAFATWPPLPDHDYVTFGMLARENVLHMAIAVAFPVGTDPVQAADALGKRMASMSATFSKSRSGM